MENNLKDIQSQKDTRGIAIQKVGISDLRYPVKIRTKNRRITTVEATFEAGVDLDAKKKGTHMSRFVENIAAQEVFDYDGVRQLLSNLKLSLDAQNSYLEMAYTHFIEKHAPVSRIKSYNDVNVGITASLDRADNLEYITKLQVPVTSLCPCSKEISDYGAHNQRCYVTLALSTDCMVDVEEIVKLVEESSSSPVYALLKRPDEKYVTEKAYENPKFVEDVSRELAVRLNEIDYIKTYEIRVDSLESIHNHLAYAYIVNQ